MSCTHIDTYTFMHTCSQPFGLAYTGNLSIHKHTHSISTSQRHTLEVCTLPVHTQPWWRETIFLHTTQTPRSKWGTVTRETHLYVRGSEAKLFSFQADLGASWSEPSAFTNKFCILERKMFLAHLWTCPGYMGGVIGTWS